jgi:hypothetical protein
MRDTVNARIPLRVEQKLAEYCTKHGLTRTEAVVRALDAYLDREAGGVDAYSLVADVIPKRGAPGLQSANVHELARKAFRGARSG